jgi:hypothetical protein
MRTRRVEAAEARALGLCNDERLPDVPAPDADGLVEIPVWRHALVNYPHPLLERGLVVLDTPGLNALGAEPELTLGLLPEAQATVFVLGADTGVTRSDMQLWREHLGARAASCFVVLNKIDTLRDPLSAPSQVTNQIESLRRATARTLDIAPERVFAVSAREALTARTHGDDAALRASRLPAFEAALGAQLLGQRHALLQGAVAEAARQLQLQVAHRAGERRRQSAEQIQELRGLRGKSANQLRAAQERAAAEAAEFEQCNVHVQALRAVHLRLLSKALATLASDALRAEVLRMQQEMRDSLLNLGARKAFAALCERLRARLEAAQDQCVELHAMLRASHARLNAEYAFGLSLDAPPTLQLFARELRAIEIRLHAISASHALRLSQPRFMEAFVRMLVSKLRRLQSPPRPRSSCGASPLRRTSTRNLPRGGAPFAAAAKRSRGSGSLLASSSSASPSWARRTPHWPLCCNLQASRSRRCQRSRPQRRRLPRRLRLRHNLSHPCQRLCVDRRCPCPSRSGREKR